MSNKEVDVVIVGGGWVGGIMGAELTKAGMTVACLERGKDNRNTREWAKPGMHDELKYAVRLGLMQDAATETWTMRHTTREAATPIRYLASFLPGTGVGGAGVHWNGQTWRFTPRDFVIRSHTEQRYGAASIVILGAFIFNNVRLLMLSGMGTQYDPETGQGTASSFPQNAGKNPTGTVGALAYRAADGIINRYVKSPGPLV